MNQIVQMFQESNSRLKKIMTGTYNREQMEDAYREFNGQVKLINTVIQAYAVASKNKRAQSALEKMNLMDDHTAIALGLPDEDMVKCPEKDRLLKREDCFDYSGSHPEDCKGCDQFSKSRSMFLGEQ